MNTKVNTELKIVQADIEEAKGDIVEVQADIVEVQIDVAEVQAQADMGVGGDMEAQAGRILM